MNKKKRPEVLFVERCVQFLRDGGVLGIVLPETFFHAPSRTYIRQFMAKHNIKWLIDLPHNTFRPHNNAKTIAVFLEKNEPQQKKINMAVAEEMGHDHQGKVMYRWDYEEKEVNKDEIWDDIELIIEELEEGKEKYVFEEDAEKVLYNDVLIPRYYWKNKEEEIRNIAENEGMELLPIKKLLDEGVLSSFSGHGSPPSEYKGRGDITYVRVKDIVNWELYEDETATVPFHVFEDMVSEKKALEANDIVYVRRGSYRIGSVAMVSPFDLESILTRELTVIRVEDSDNEYCIDSYYLLYLLSHRLIKMQTFSKVLIETTLPNIKDRWKELKLPVYKDLEKRKEMSSRIKEIIENKWEATKEIVKLQDELGDITT